MKLKIGDVVTFLGGIKMTVEVIMGDDTRCVWFTSNGNDKDWTLHREWFPTKALKVI